MYYALKKTLLCLASMSMIAGCSDSGEFDDFNEFDDRAIEDPATEDELVERNQEITGLSRIDDSNTSPRWPSVGQVRNRTVRCSGTLITPVHVLTAGHCFPGGMNGPTTVIFDATANSTSAARTFNVIQESALGRAVASGQDLSILLLDRTVPTSIATPSTIPTGIFAEFLTAHWTRTFWTVGFGQDCARTGTGTRRGLLLPSSMATYSRYPGVLAHPNGNCFNPTYLAPQPGDSGGPLFDSSERVIAVFSGYSCRNVNGDNVSSNVCGPVTSQQTWATDDGTIEWTWLNSANQAWINGRLGRDFDSDGIADRDDTFPGLNCAMAPLDSRCLPDIVVESVRASGCTSTGGDPTVEVTVRNVGDQAASAWIDVFEGLGSPPSVGTFSTIFRRTRTLQPDETERMGFALQPTRTSSWVDVLVDTTQTLTEANESNNHFDEFITYPDCSLN